MRNGETLNAYKRPTPPIPQIPFFTPDNQLIEPVRKIFEEWYNKFAENGKMNSEGCAKFIDSCTQDGCQAGDQRVKDVFAQWDKDKDGILTLADFLEFYTSSCRDKP